MGDEVFGLFSDVFAEAGMVEKQKGSEAELERCVDKRGK